jgi:hypothetical protein
VALCRFALVLLFACVLVCLVYREALSCSFGTFVSDTRNTRVLVLGDSHPLCAINVDGWDGTFNFAGTMESLPYNNIKLEMLSEHCSDLKTVILGLSYHSLACPPDLTLDKAYVFYFSLFPLMKDSPIPRKHSAYRAWLDAKLNHSFGIVTKNAIPGIKGVAFEHRSLAKERIPRRYHVAPVPVEWEPRIRSHYFSPELNSPPSPSMNALHRIRDFCLQKGYKLVLYNSPVVKEYFEHIPPEYKYLTDSIACAMTDNQNVYYLNYSQYPLPDSCFWDCDHTNIYGARIITPLLRDSLAALGIIALK